VVADVGGWFTDGTNSTASGSTFVGLVPARVLDTRNNIGGFSTPVGPATTIAVTVAGQGGVPPMNATVPPAAVVLNLAATNPTAVPSSFLTVWPGLATRPTASDLNFVTWQTVSNLVVVKVGPDGRVNFYNAAGSVDVVADVVGWYG
jgi:hypothetical protein